MTRPGTFERVYTALKDRLCGGAFRPGERLEPAVLSDALNASVTPVREALHRLTGERLVEAPKHDGFRAPQLTETTLRHLYSWHLDILLLAAARPGVDRFDRPAADSFNDRLERAFAELAAASGNPEHFAALRNVTDRLGPYQQLEAEFLDAVDTECNGILSAIQSRDRSAVRRSLVAYHRRRQRIIPDLITRLQASSFD